MTELALPAGSLSAALVAFNYGADGVYFGLEDFSARKGAINFTISDLSKLRAYALKNNKKIYITINTLIDDSALPKLYETLAKVNEIGADGIIVQDLGVISLIRRDFPSLPLHASTQLAVHTINGVRALQRLGFERVVLSRELSLEEIKKIRVACPDIELKVFIHGAMCYGFSGLCMASKIKTGRSANEGSCAQICRTYFTDEATKKTLYPFSLKDLEAGPIVKELQKIGIDSLKIEGRLKGNGYVAATAKYYRALLDGKEENQELKDDMAFTFLRESSSEYLSYSGPNHSRLNTTLYTGHLGRKLGRVIDKRGNTIKLDTHVSQYDGLMVLRESKNGLYEPYKFSAIPLRSGYISLPDSSKVEVGMDIYKISDSSLNIREPSLELPLFKKPLPIKLEIRDDSLLFNDRVKIPVKIEEGRGSKGLDEIKRIFSQRGEAEFTPELTIINSSSYSTPFLPSSRLKEIRREVYSTLRPEQITHSSYSPIINKELKSCILPKREGLDGERAPWSLEGKEIDGYSYFTFPPITFSEEKLFKEMEERVKNKERVRIGLNNIAQLEFANKHSQYEYFIDIYLYLSNREAASLLSSNVKNLIGGYLWLERDQAEPPWPFVPTLASDYRPPLFISRSCYRHDSLGLPCDGCKRHHTFSVRQNDKAYSVYVDNCITIVKEKGAAK